MKIISDIQENVHRILKNTEYLFEYQHTYEPLLDIAIDIYDEKVRKIINNVLYKPEEIIKLYSGYNFRTENDVIRDFVVKKNDRKSPLPIYLVFRYIDNIDDISTYYRKKKQDNYYSDNDIIVIRFNSKYIRHLYDSSEKNKIKTVEHNVVNILTHELDRVLKYSINIENRVKNTPEYEISNISTEFNKNRFGLSTDNTELIENFVYVIDEFEYRARCTQIESYIKSNKDDISIRALDKIDYILDNTERTPPKPDKSLLIASILSLKDIDKITKLSELFVHLDYLKKQRYHDIDAYIEIFVLGNLFWKFKIFNIYPTDKVNYKNLKTLFSDYSVQYFVDNKHYNNDLMDETLYKRCIKKCVDTIEHIFLKYEWLLANNIDKHLTEIFDVDNLDIDDETLLHTVLSRKKKYTKDRISKMREMFEKYEKYGFNPLPVIRKQHKRIPEEDNAILEYF